MLIRLFLYLIFFCISYGAKAQQNFFNIPSGQMTPEGKFFYQHQVNFFSINNMSSKQHFAWGLNDHLEVGLNFQNYDPNGRIEKTKQIKTGPQSNILAPTIQKSFSLDEKISLNIGSQMGLSHIATDASSYITGKTYGIFSFYDPKSHLRMTAGSWVSGQRFNGPGNYFGLLVGLEWMVTEGYYLMSDWVSGDTQNSVSVVGGMVDIGKGLQVCVGYLIPNPGSPENHGLVLELNIFNF